MKHIRELIVEEARTWIGTPFVHEARMKGVGCDCATLIADVYERVLGLTVTLPHYSIQWNLHTNRQPYLVEMLKHAKEVSAFPHEQYVPAEATYSPRFRGFPIEMWDKKPPLPGDLAVWWFGLNWAHTTIVLEWPIVLNAMMYDKVSPERAEVLGSSSERSMRMRLIRPFILCDQ